MRQNTEHLSWIFRCPIQKSHLLSLSLSLSLSVSLSLCLSFSLSLFLSFSLSLLRIYISSIILAQFVPLICDEVYISLLNTLSQVLLLLPSRVIKYSPFLSCLITEFTLISFFPSLSQCLYLISSYIITYSAFLSTSFMMKSTFPLFLLHHRIYICFLLTPRSLHSTSS